MRTKTKNACIPMCALVVLIPLACGDDDGSPMDPTDETDGTGEPAAVVISPGTHSFSAIGDSTQLTAEVSDAAGNGLSDATVTWVTSNSAVASVTPDGWVKSRDNGAAEIIAAAGDAADTVTIEVQQVPVTISVSPADITLAQGETVQLTANLADANGIAIDGSNATVTWSSADEAVATVNDARIVTGVRGGNTQVSATAADVIGYASVTVLDRLAFASDRDGNWEIYTVNSDGSGLTRITFNSTMTDEKPVWSPDGTKIAFERALPSDPLNTGDIFVVNPDRNDEPTRLTMSAAVDHDPAWFPGGTVIAFVTERDGQSEIYSMELDRTVITNLSNNPAADRLPALSPDGAKIAFFSNRNVNADIYVMNADGTEQTRLTSAPASVGSPAWAPDGTKIVFISERDGPLDVYAMNADGSGLIRLTNDAAFQTDPLWSPDGTKIVFSSIGDDDRFDIHIVNPDGSGRTNLTPTSPGSHVWARWLPNGSKIAFISTRDGDRDIYIMNADGSNVINVTDNSAEDKFPAWRPRAD